MLKFIQMFLTIPVINNIYMCIAFSKVFIERYDITVSCIQSVGLHEVRLSRPPGIL